ncbi:ABC transporter permease [Microbacterium sp. GCS4]|uniref:ABC transporter permease n=1 Tax=Microbacterium sp. GCS4 TaxID=1692239 RepID=UPI000680A18F|nr:ABC transporter permease [Microbacterium sp. GCS4]
MNLTVPWRERLLSWEWLLGAFAIAVLVYACIATPGFADAYNLESSVARMAPKALLVLPLVLLVIAREIDISVASIAGLSGIVFGMLYQSGVPLWPAVLGALVVGGACGTINAILVALLRLPSLIVTLGTLALFRGLCYVLVGGTPISAVPPELIDFSYGLVPGTVVPTAIVPFVVLAAATAVILHRMPFGRRVYAIGGNPDTARYAGVRTTRMLITMFIASGVVAALAGVIQVGLTSSATPDGMIGFELDALTVVFLGGVSFLGGRGKISGVLWALVVVIVVRSMLQLQNVGAFGQAAVIGVILIASLLLADTVSRVARSRATASARASRSSVPTGDGDTTTGSAKEHHNA